MFMPSLKFLFCGILLGAAGVMPGLSGGSIALILGIYERLVDAMANLAPRVLIPALKKRSWNTIFTTLDMTFLALVGGGKVIGIFLFSLFMPFLVQHYPDYTNALFFGLVAASVPHLLISQSIRLKHIFTVLISASIAWFLTTLTSHLAIESLHIQFISGILAFIAMLLPGLSGSFVLLLMGNYHYIFTQIHRVFFFDSDAIVNLIPFGMGALVGLIIFVSTIRYCLKHFHDTTRAALVGLMIGALPALWPFAQFKQHFYLPYSFGLQEFYCIILMMIGLFITAISLKALKK